MARKDDPRLNDTRVTRGDSRGAFYDLFPPDEAAELMIRATLPLGLEVWITTWSSQDFVDTFDEGGSSPVALCWRTEYSRKLQLPFRPDRLPWPDNSWAPVDFSLSFSARKFSIARRSSDSLPCDSIS